MKWTSLMLRVIILTLSSLLWTVQCDGDPQKLLEEWWETVSTSFPRYEETTQLLQNMETNFPRQVKVYSVGKSFEKREMWVIRLSQDLSKPRPKLVPPVKLVANMHGDEVLGRALVLLLAVDILTKFNQNDPRVMKLLETTDIHLMPSVNPDGFEAVEEGSCDPNPDKKGRLTANNKDLNRDFPDQFDTKPQDFKSLLAGREVETQNMMRWITSTYFVLSGNLHALTLVASYPFDSVPLEMAESPNYPGEGVISKSPDHEVFFHLATQYSQNHKTMHKYNDCSKGQFKNGVTNGAEWYNVRGGMQDFAYVHGNTMEITFELSCCKFPDSKTLKTEWDNNIEALYSYLEAAHMGVKGIVYDATNKIVQNAKIHVKDNTHSIRTTPQGEYWRLLMPGKTYQMWASKEGLGTSDYIDVTIEQGVTTIQDFKLRSTTQMGRSMNKNTKDKKSKSKKPVRD